MNKLSRLFSEDAFSMSSSKKNFFFLNYLNNLNLHHYNKSDLYKRYLDKMNFKSNKYSSLVSFHFLPVRLFKEFDFLSIKRKNIFNYLIYS